MLIYRLTFSSGKVYIGQTVKSLKTRMNNHRQNMKLGSQLPVHNAWRLYGEPLIEVLAKYEDAASLNAAEIEFIKSHGCISPSGYNLADGGAPAGPKHPDTRAKIAAKATGRKYSEETKALVRENSRKQWQDPEYRAKVLAGVTKSMTDERRAISKATMVAIWEKRKAEGWQFPEETRRKQSNRVASEETRAKMSEAAKRRVRVPPSAETRAKFAENAKAFWSDPANVARRAEQIRQGHARRKELAAQEAIKAEKEAS